jgi:hypothetical protein
LTYTHPNLENEEHIIAFIRGYIDGDGGIYEESGLNTNMIRLRGTEPTLNYIRKQFDLWVPESLFPKTSEVHKFDYEAVASYRVTGKRGWKLLQHLTTVNTLYLRRKWFFIKEKRSP